MNPIAGRPRPFGVFFPSLSTTIVWKAGPVSSVRFAAQKPRALDTGPAFQEKTLLGRKRREALATGKATALQSAGLTAATTFIPDPAGP